MEVKNSDICDTQEDASESASSHNSVKSTAVVKYSAVDSPASFALLQCNTDLNMPPANWLSSSAESYGLQYVLSNSTGFSSFRMADMFPDCVGEVDVVSDAENIKKLLKLPYSQGPVSMLVHRIKTTLLLDDFDVQKTLFRSPEVNWHSSLKNFLSEQVIESSKKSITDESHRRNVLQQENLISKFLYHSIGNLEKKEPEKLRATSEHSERENVASTSTRPPLPEPNITKELPDTDSKHKFVRNVVWTFENIQMLLGTDMPIFGGGTHPCVSLRLRDMSKPISVLTGIDYWLDNLMCNVPEVAMCYHIGGIVQKYELIKTEDLPYMEDSNFSPMLIRDVAQNILAFLKSNATKAGHTYWLLKGKDDDVVKLYDLTSLCSSNMDSSHNPFTIPVALLLYRVARNMKHAPRVSSPTNPGTIRMLLRNCIRLLPVEKYPQIVSSAHYMFSDSLIPLKTDPITPNLEDVYDKIFASNDKKDIVYGNASEMNEDDECIKTLCLSQKPTHSFHNSLGNSFSEEEYQVMRSLEKRCKTALEHIADGLTCLKYFDACDGSSSVNSKSSREENLNMANPSTPIPMPYESINKENDETNRESTSVKSAPPQNKKKKKASQKEEDFSIGAMLCKSHVEAMPTWQNPPDVDDSIAWKKHLKILLYEKACLVYATLAEYEYSTESFGNALKHIRLVLESRSHLTTNGSCENRLMSYLLGRAGDCCFKIGKKWHSAERYKADYATVEKADAKLKAVMDEENVPSYEELKFLPLDISSLDNVLNHSWMCYKKALELEDRYSECDELHRRLGNICNELGSYYMKQAREIRRDDENWKKKIEALFAISMTHLENGINAFKNVNDEANLALLYSNTGRLMRLMAHYYGEENAPLNKPAKSYYLKALNNYQSALATLSYRRLNPEIWDTVSYELSTTLYTLATLLQDFPSSNSIMNKSELEREVAEYLSKALKYCDMETPGPRQPIYQYRAADIHHRLASLYHNSYRDLDKDSPRRSKIMQLCLLHYERAASLFQLLELPPQFLRAQLEKVALYEFVSQNATGTAGQIKNLQNALALIMESAPILKMVCDSRTAENLEQTDGNEMAEGNNAAETGENRNVSDETDEEQRMLDLLESRLQFILRSLIKKCLSNAKYSSLVPNYKNMYSALLENIRDKVSIEQRLHRVVTQFMSTFKDE